MARFLVQAILWRDYPIVQNLVMFIAIVVILSNLIVDLLYGWPRSARAVWRLAGVADEIALPSRAPRAHRAPTGGRGPRSAGSCRKKPLGRGRRLHHARSSW